MADEPAFRIVPRSIVGTGNPMDQITMIPLIHSWHPARGCAIADPDEGDKCDAAITRIVIVDHTDPPNVFTGEGWKNGLAFCEPHFKLLTSET